MMKKTVSRIHITRLNRAISALLIVALLMPSLVMTSAAGTPLTVQPVLLQMAADQPDQAVRVIVQKATKGTDLESVVARLGGAGYACRAAGKGKVGQDAIGRRVEAMPREHVGVARHGHRGRDADDRAVDPLPRVRHRARHRVGRHEERSEQDPAREKMPQHHARAAAVQTRAHDRKGPDCCDDRPPAGYADEEQKDPAQHHRDRGGLPHASWNASDEQVP